MMLVYRFVKTTGLLPDKNYAYTASVGRCRLPMEGEKRVYVDEVYQFDGDEEDMADWVANKGPITIGRSWLIRVYSLKLNQPFVFIQFIESIDCSINLSNKKSINLLMKLCYNF